MIELRPFSTLGAADHGWLDAHHHFSFADYHDPARTNWGRLRVWNDDAIAPGTGFPAHPHHDMEIVTYVREARSRTATAWAIRAGPRQATSR
jgi:redox-sensitive bicupin YhaK (pirin superfamily)